MRKSGLFFVVALMITAVMLDADEPQEREEFGGIAVLESLNELILKNVENHKELVRKYGAEHPAVKRSERELASLENMRVQKLKQMPSWARRSIASMNDHELRYMVGVLVERVIRLEDEVEKLKNPDVRIDLLGS